jgi:hypothetical protein
MPIPPGSVISTILKYDAKVTSYKIALLRAINDVVLSFSDLQTYERPIAIPLRTLAAFWVAYYWPFVDSVRPIMQGPRSRRGDTVSSDMAFRADLTSLRAQWEALAVGEGLSHPSDGFYMINELRVPRRRALYPPALLQTYEQALRSVARTIEMPIRYAGLGQWSVFPRPTYLSGLSYALPIPGALQSDLCLVIDPNLWRTFQDVSLWVEALCIHEWCLFTERVAQEDGVSGDRGDVYRLLTSRPDNRRPLTWEHNQVDILLMEGAEFICPWTERRIRGHIAYDLDHLVPMNLYPINEMWNLVPSDPRYNRDVKRDRLPSTARLARAAPHLALAYSNYERLAATSRAIHEDAKLRFYALARNQKHQGFAGALSAAVVEFISQVADSRNWARF